MYGVDCKRVPIADRQLGQGRVMYVSHLGAADFRRLVAKCY